MQGEIKNGIPKGGHKEMCKILEDVVTEEHIRIIHTNRAKGISDEDIANFLGKSIDYVRKGASMSSVLDQWVEKGQKEVLYCFVENALALGMEPAMVAQIADSSDPFVQDLITSPPAAQTRKQHVVFFTDRGEGTSMWTISNEVKATAARREVYRLICRMETEDVVRALHEISIDKCYAMTEVLGIDLVDWAVIYAEGNGEAAGEQRAVSLVSLYMKGEKISELAEQYGKTEAEVEKMLDKAGLLEYWSKCKKRDPKRIRAFCDQLAEIWESQCPDWRFGQLIWNVLPHDPFFLEEEQTLKMFKEFFNLDK